MKVEKGDTLGTVVPNVADEDNASPSPWKRPPLRRERGADRARRPMVKGAPAPSASSTSRTRGRRAACDSRSKGSARSRGRQGGARGQGRHDQSSPRSSARTETVARARRLSARLAALWVRANLRPRTVGGIVTAAKRGRATDRSGRAGRSCRRRRPSTRGRAWAPGSSTSAEHDRAPSRPPTRDRRRHDRPLRRATKRIVVPSGAVVGSTRARSCSSGRRRHLSAR
jgi:hypothetical protein